MQPVSIDVLLAVYNGEAYLREFLESLFTQSCSDFQLIVSDNKSTDGTVAILESYSDRFPGRITILPPPLFTVPAVRNFARVADAARSRYVMFADADDVWHPDKIEKTFRAMGNAERQYGETSPILVHSDLAVVGRDLSPIHPSYWSYQNIAPSRTELRHLLLRNCVTGCTVMMNSAMMKLALPIPQDAPMHDYWCALNAAAFGHIVAIAEPLIDYRQHGANDTGATRWGIGFLLKRLKAQILAGRLRESIRAKTRQAAELAARHGARLTPEDRHLVEVFVTLLEVPGLERRFRLLRYRLWDDGMIRNVGLFLTL
jgi:glycosyltransferase involved in cell wall biosynthesis